MMLNSTSFNRKFSFALVAILALGCGSVARVAQPAAVYSEVTVDDYSEAEDHFAGVAAGGGPKGVYSPVNPIVTTYWDDEKCQQLVNRRDGCLIAIAAIGALTGAGGLTVALPTDASKDTKTAVGYTTLALAATVAGLTLAVSQMNTKLGYWCRLERPEPPVSVEHPASDEIELAPLPGTGRVSRKPATPSLKTSHSSTGVNDDR